MKYTWAYILLLMFILLPVSLFADNVSLLGSFEFWDTASDIIGDDELLVVNTDGTGIKILDVSDIDNIIETATIQNLSHTIYNILYEDEHLYVCTSSNVYIYDLTVHNNPVLFDTIHLQSYAYTFTLADTLLLAGGEYLTCYDISDLSDITLLSSTLLDTSVDCIICIDNYVYGTAYDLVTYNISDPSNPVLINHAEIDINLRQCLGAANSDSHLYFWDADEHEDFPPYTDLEIINIEDRENPIHLPQVRFDYESTDIKVHQYNMFIVDGSGDFKIYNLQNPGQPQLNSSTTFGFSLTRMFLKDNTAYISDQYSGFKIIDIEDPSIPTLTANYMKVGSAKHFTVSGDYAYTSGFSNLSILDITDRLNIEIVWNYHNNNILASSVYNPVVLGNHLYISSGYYFKVYDISNLRNPVEAGSYELDHRVGYLFPHNNYLIASHLSGTSGCKVLDISNPTIPRIIADFLPGSDLTFWNYIMDAEFVDNYAYMTFEDDILAVIDISDLTSASVVTTCDPDYRLVEIQDQYAFAARSRPNDVLDIMDITDPINPLVINTHDLGANIFNLEVDGPIGIVGSDGGHITIYDMNNTSEFQQVGDFTLPTQAIKIELIESTLFTGHEKSFNILDCTDAITLIPNSLEDPKINLFPEAFLINKAYPNPFNPTLNVEISLPKMGNLEVSVYNMLGQKVANLANQQFQAGNHTFTFDGSKLSSGVYLINASLAGETCKVKKITLVK